MNAALSRLPISPPYLPTEAATADEIPVGDVWQYEPRWMASGVSHFATVRQYCCNRKQGSRWSTKRLAKATKSPLNLLIS